MSNLITEFSSEYIGILNKTRHGNYAQNGSEYHELITTFRELISSIDSSDLSIIKTNKQTFIKALEKVQDNVRTVWNIVFPTENYPEQTTIHGINIVILRIQAKLAEAKLK